MASGYQRYREIRDTAWRALIQMGAAELPVQPEALARSVGAELEDFPDPEAQPRLTRLLKQTGGLCASLRIEGAWHIFVRQDASGDRRRFALAHELGHLLLSHPTRALTPGVRAFVGPPCAGDMRLDAEEGTADYEADMFAIRLLAPACVLLALRVRTAEDAAGVCGMPPKAASIRAERMELLIERDAFLTHPLERTVRDRFRPWVQERMGFTAPVKEEAFPAVPPSRPRMVYPVPQRDLPPERPETEESEAEREIAPLFESGRRRWLLYLALAGISLAVAVVIFFFL